MAIVLMALGSYRFGIPEFGNYVQDGLGGSRMGHDNLTRVFPYRWVGQERIGSRVAQQFLGAGEEVISIHGLIYPHYTGGFGQLINMRNEASVGEPMPLASARGYYLGLWCIRAIQDVQEYFHPNGDPRKVEFDIELVNYGEEGGGGGGAIQVRNDGGGNGGGIAV